MKNLKTSAFLTFIILSFLGGNKIVSSPDQASKPEMIADFSKQILAFARAQAEVSSMSSETLLQTVRMMYQLSTGMTQANYNALIADQPAIAEILDTDGFLGRVNSTRKTVSNAILTHVPGITACADVPSSGSFTLGNAIATFGTPKHKAPTGYPHGGGSNYQKRLEWSETQGSVTTRAVFEFNCDVAASMLAVEYSDTAIPANNHKIGLFYDGEIFDNKHFQFYLSFPAGNARIASSLVPIKAPFFLKTALMSHGPLLSRLP